MTSTEPPERALADAAARGLEVALLSRTSRPEGVGPDGTVAVKTIVLHRRDGFVFVLVPLDERFSWPKLRAALGVNRVRLPSEDEAYQATGYRRGTITPLGAGTAFPVVADLRILGHDITLGSGSPGHAVRVRADDLVRAYDATVVDLVPGGPASSGEPSTAR
ncbi:aminoacyl-tRNA deacylase [Myceligenerans indicum]|uniref:YbaK/EbsC family protein n=1 Tax=Myceligenerans indicum TaxID=2593663 RepID=A0ABS1LIA0_9MICO|nr:YbaK/EbsC family protein [Myceligenerans indicum]MBL0885946.1 YbaK/EbsC family protein [Myceligenerans indicum]